MFLSSLAGVLDGFDVALDSRDFVPCVGACVFFPGLGWFFDIPIYSFTRLTLLCRGRGVGRGGIRCQLLVRERHHRPRQRSRYRPGHRRKHSFTLSLGPSLSPNLR